MNTNIRNLYPFEDLVASGNAVTSDSFCRLTVFSAACSHYSAQHSASAFQTYKQSHISSLLDLHNIHDFSPIPAYGL
jgi:hypothetical protein